MSSSVGSPPVSGSRRTSASTTENPSRGQPLGNAAPDARRRAGDDGRTRHRGYPFQPGYAGPMGVAFVAHCLLNQNAKTDGGARCPGVYSPAVEVLRAEGWRIEQMPCPELAFTGLNRFWAVREQYDTPAHRRHCQRLAASVADAISVRVGRGEDIVLIGIEGSPSMGVCITSSDPLRGGRPAVAGRRPGTDQRRGHLHRGTAAGTAAAGNRLPPGGRADASAARSRRGGRAGRPPVRAGSVMESAQAGLRPVLDR